MQYTEQNMLCSISMFNKAFYSIKQKYIQILYHIQVCSHIFNPDNSVHCNPRFENTHTRAHMKTQILKHETMNSYQSV